MENEEGQISKSRCAWPCVQTHAALAQGGHTAAAQRRIQLVTMPGPEGTTGPR